MRHKVKKKQKKGLFVNFFSKEGGGESSIKVKKKRREGFRRKRQDGEDRQKESSIFVDCSFLSVIDLMFVFQFVDFYYSEFLQEHLDADWLHVSGFQTSVSLLYIDSCCCSTTQVSMLLSEPDTLLFFFSFLFSPFLCSWS